MSVVPRMAVRSGSRSPTATQNYEKPNDRAPKRSGGVRRQCQPRCHLAVRAMLGVAILAAVAVGTVQTPTAGASTLAPLVGEGSTLTALAFQQWTQAEKLRGLTVTYTATGTAAGLAEYATTSDVDFAGSEAEYSEKYPTTPVDTLTKHVSRGFAYAPDVGDATAIMYHVAANSTGSDPVTDLRLSPLTVARIFLGDITNWESSTISADNNGLVLPNEPIRLNYRTGQSGSTALFYDFVQHTDPSQYATWASEHGYPTDRRVWELDDGSTGFPPANASGYPGATQQAEAVASPDGLWSIGYDEFGYAKVYQDEVAAIENASGAWILPSASNVSTALETAVPAATTAETLSRVYNSSNPAAYPISFYSYLVYQCAPNKAIPTCVSANSDPGVTNAMATFMMYIACSGQQKMATIGYAPLPPNLSQQLADAVGDMTGNAPEVLTAQNCTNPEFSLLRPTIAKITPSAGSTAGGTSVTLTGTNFVAGGTLVSFGGALGTAVDVSSPTSLTVIAPQHAAGTVTVRVTTTHGSSTLSSAFTYGLAIGEAGGTVMQPIAETVEAGRLTLSCTRYATVETTPTITTPPLGVAIKTCKIVKLPSIQLSGVQQIRTSIMNPIYVDTARGTATAGWGLSAAMVPTVSNPTDSVLLATPATAPHVAGTPANETITVSASCATAADFCDETGTLGVTAKHGQIPATDLTLNHQYACTPAPTNHNPTPGSLTTGAFGTGYTTAHGTFTNRTLALCTAAAGTSGGEYKVSGGKFTLTVPSIIRHGMYFGTVEFTLVSIP